MEGIKLGTKCVFYILMYKSIIYGTLNKLARNIKKNYEQIHLTSKAEFRYRVVYFQSFQ